jgi:hypothetical protein
MEAKIKEWKLITKDERKDLDYMLKMKELYVAHKEGYSTDPNYIHICNAVTERKEDAAKQLAKLEAMQAKLNKQAEHLVRKSEQQIKFADAINEQKIYYVAKDSRYYYYDEQQNIWETLQAEATYKMLGLANTEERVEFDRALKDQGRMKLRAVNTFNPHTANELNLLDKNTWLKPIPLDDDEEVDEWIDLLITSVAGESQAAKDHLEQVIFWKYHHPEDYNIPAQSPYGVGGALKNKLIEDLLATIFGKHQVIVIGTEHAFGGYNGQMVGRTIVFIDEAVSEKTNSETLKRQVMNKTININVKYGMQGTFDNTALFFIAGNEAGGALLLDGSPTDRRFSVYRNNRTSYEIIAEKFGTYFNAGNERDPRNAETAQLYQANEWRFSDPTLVAKWLYHISIKWGDKLTCAPIALHDVDYVNLLKVQQPSWKTTLEEVFSSPEMTKVEHITGGTLFKVYELIHARDGSKNGWYKRKGKFLAEVRLWLQKHHPQWQWVPVNIKMTANVGTGKAQKERTSADAFVCNNKKTFKDNEDFFIEVDAYGKERLQWWLR